MQSPNDIDYPIQSVENDKNIIEPVENTDEKVIGIAQIPQYGDDGVAEEHKTMHWFHAALVMIAETISLGILSLPSVLSEIGLIPGIVLILSMSVITTYTAYVLGQFKAKYPHVHNMADAGFILFGPVGREIFGLGSALFLIFVMASHVLAFSLMMNVITDHGACTIVFMVIGAVVSFVFTIPRTLKALSYFSISSFLSVIAAVMVIMIAVGIQNSPAGAVELTRKTSLYMAFSGVTNIAFAYAGHLTFFTFISEMKKPSDYPKALMMLQACDTILYLVTAVVVYRYIGHGVGSPALSSTHPLISKIAYGIACPTIVISGVVNGNVAAKYIINRVEKAANVDLTKSKRGFLFWIGLVFSLWLVAWLIAEGIPVFNGLLGVISALFVSWFSFGVNGMFWFHLNRGSWTATMKNIFLCIVNGFMIFTTFVIMVCGMYSSVMGIKQFSGVKVFSCADNVM